MLVWGNDGFDRNLFGPLIRYGSGFPTDLIRIAEKIIFCQIQMAVELEDIRDGSRKVQLYDFAVRNPFQMLDDTAQAVAVRDDQQLILEPQAGEDCLLPIGKDA